MKLREQGVDAIGFKPVVTGIYKDAQGATVNEDLETLRLASNLIDKQLRLCPRSTSRSSHRGNQKSIEA
jgi:dethiobiotin synthetase